MTGAATQTMELDASSFWRLAYEEHGPDLLAFLRSRAPRRDDAEELLQETFVRAMRATSGLRDPAKVRSYLFTTACNLVRNQLRRDRGTPFVTEPCSEETRGAESADARVRMRQLLERLTTVVEALPEGQRRAFELGVIERVPYRQIAHQTGWSVAKVKVSVYRARRRVVDALAELLPSGSEETA